MSRHLQCRRCEEVIEFPVNAYCYAACLLPLSQAERDAWLYPYQMNVGCVVPTRAVWCGACNRPSHAERLPSQLELINAIGLARLGQDPDRVTLHDEIPEDALLEFGIPELRCLAQALERRKHPGKCLWCGGYSYMPIEVRDEEVLNLRHEGCGGKFVYPRPRFMVGAGIPIRVRPQDGDGREPRWFDFDGNFIAQSYYVFEPDETMGWTWAA